MATVLQSHRFSQYFRSRFYLCLCWVLGMFAGIGVYFYAAFDFASLMLGFCFSSVSIVGFLFAAAFPFLITAFAVLFSKPWFLLVISFLKAFSFTVCSIGLMDAYDGSGWLIRFFLMFYEIVSLPALYAFWSRAISVGCSVAECFGWLSFAILAGSVDYRFVYPFYIGLGIL